MNFTLASYQLYDDGKALESVFKFLIYIILEEEISACFSILAGKIPWTEEGILFLLNPVPKTIWGLIY